MKINLEPIRSWFGFTRRERRSVFILLIIIIIIIGIRYTVPEKDMEVEDITASFIARNRQPELVTLPVLFSFNPNLTSYDSLIQLGLSDKEAATLISYRKKGGKFNKAEDLKKVYGIDGPKAEKLIPFVVLPKALKDTIRNKRPAKKLHIELNTCDSASLLRLPGIGPVLAARIIKYRHLLGSFASVEQIREVYGLPAETFGIIRESLFIDSLTIKKVNVNLAEYRDLARFPYLEKYEVTSILKYREIKGKIGSMADLTGNKLISEEKAGKLKPYFIF